MGAYRLKPTLSLSSASSGQSRRTVSKAAAAAQANVDSTYADQNLIYAELIANAARFAAVGAVCYFVDDPLRMIVSSAAIYPIIELALFVFLAFHGSRRK